MSFYDEENFVANKKDNLKYCLSVWNIFEKLMNFHRNNDVKCKRNSSSGIIFHCLRNFEICTIFDIISYFYLFKRQINIWNQLIFNYNYSNKLHISFGENYV